MHEVHFSTNDQWHVGQETRHVVFQESFVIHPVSLFGSSWGPNKLSPQIPGYMLMENWYW
jgi:hypothetical protein